MKKVESNIWPQLSQQSVPSMLRNIIGQLFDSKDGIFLFFLWLF